MGFRVWGSEFGGWGLGAWVSGLGFRVCVWGLRFGFKGGFPQHYILSSPQRFRGFSSMTVL